MTGIDQEIQKLKEDCPILLDEDFLREHPAIVNVASFLDGAVKGHDSGMGRYPAFDKLGVDNIKDYLVLVQEGNQEAIGLYERTRGILRLH